MILSATIFFLLFASSRCIGGHSYDSLNNAFKGKDRKERKESERRGEKKKRERERGKGRKEQHSLMRQRKLESKLY